MEEKTPKYLVMVTGANNNKYYRMIPHGESWTAEFGRVGAAPQSMNYPMREWDKKYKEKIKKGYVDQTDLAADLIEVEAENGRSTYKEIESKVIAEIVERLQRMARDAVQANYRVSANQVTQAMIDEAQSEIDGLLKIADVNAFNDALLKLFTVVPRKMANVSDYLIRDADSIPKTIQREQDLLDVMKGQVLQKQKIEFDTEDEGDKADRTILETLGLEFGECTPEDVARIKSSLGSCADKFHAAWRVKNLKTQERFDKFVAENGIKDIRLLFHGSRNENWWSIINSGLVLRPTNAVITGKMFGYGIYYAPKAQKSLGYTSLSGSYWARGSSSSGFMALMDVAYGKPFDAYSFESRFSSLDYNGLQRLSPGANCLHAHAGSMLRNDEIIVYKEEQSTIRYLVELK